MEGRDGCSEELSLPFEVFNGVPKPVLTLLSPVLFSLLVFISFLELLS